MTRHFSAMLGFTLVAFLLASPCVCANEEVEIALSDCPKGVQRTLKRESQGGKIKEVEREEDDGKMIFEAEVILDGKEYEVEVAEDGTLLSKILEEDDAEREDEEEDDDGDDEEEVEIKLSDCPKAVQKTLKRESRRGKIEEITKETEGQRTVYEADVEIGGKDYEVEVAADGTLLEKVLEDEDDDEEDEDEEGEEDDE